MHYFPIILWHLCSECSYLYFHTCRCLSIKYFFNFHRLFLLAEKMTVKIALIANFFNWNSFQFIVCKVHNPIIALILRSPGFLQQHLLPFIDSTQPKKLSYHSLLLEETISLFELALYLHYYSITIFVRTCYQNLPHQTELIKAIIIVSSLCAIVNIPDDTMT